MYVSAVFRILNSKQMKKYILITMSFLAVLKTTAQKDFRWEKIDSTTKTKNELYAVIKTFVAENWRSANDVIQNDDKENGIVILKGLTSTITSKFQLNYHDYTYQYTIKFLIKENKYKIVLENVHCYRATCANYTWPDLEPTEDTTHKQAGVPAEKVAEIMQALRNELSALFNRCVAGIERPAETGNGEW